MAVESLADFEAMSFLPHVIVYAVYVGVKYTLLLTELVLHFLSRYHRHSLGQIANSDVVHILFFLFSLLTLCFCCCCCCGKKRGAISYLFDKTHIFSAKLMHFVVATLFGSGEGIVERYLTHDKAKKLKTPTSTIPKLYIRNMELSSCEVSHLALLFFTFILLTNVTSWDLFFLDESYVCSESPNVSCFPIPKDPLLGLTTDGMEVGVDFSEIHKQRITNCSFWNSDSISSQVTFMCFHWVFNSDATISAFGGLLMIFVLTVKIVVAALITLSEAVIGKVTQWNGEWINVFTGFRFRIGDGLKAIRLTILVLVALFELTFGLLLTIGYVRVQGKHANGLLMFYRNLGNQVLLSIGLLSIFLLLPFEKYAMNGRSCTEDSDDGGGGGESENEEERERDHHLATEDV